ncbi:hypothetical protein E2C01_085551 [Portunus trituberculatus]|uniref:Uncharacterized protein n=1 Tax=Portunus trituberculatus TaxID=210409 RepID=A0A5B7JC82_PORTR|nr:hypothetical protein [Portunus trituberculatus]
MRYAHKPLHEAKIASHSVSPHTQRPDFKEPH